MSFAKDFAAGADSRIAALQSERAKVIDAIHALFFDVNGSQIFQLPSDSRDELQRLKNQELSLDARISEIDAQKTVYLKREKEQERLHRSRNSLRQKYVAVLAARPPLREPYQPPAEWNCSLAGASPPWNWTWGDFVPFSEMQTSTCDHVWELLWE